MTQFQVNVGISFEHPDKGLLYYHPAAEGEPPTIADLADFPPDEVARLEAEWQPAIGKFTIEAVKDKPDAPTEDVTTDTKPFSRRRGLEGSQGPDRSQVQVRAAEKPEGGADGQ
jgi:hypothetical protein